MEKFMNGLGVFFDVAFIAGLIFIFILLCAAVVRVIKKLKKGDPVKISPVGVFGDLPESITGMKNEDDEEEEKEEKEEEALKEEIEKEEEEEKETDI